MTFVNFSSVRTTPLINKGLRHEKAAGEVDPSATSEEKPVMNKRIATGAGGAIQESGVFSQE